MARATLTLAFVLAGAELVVGVPRGWSFPYVNLYEADSDYGVRLEADAHTSLRSRQGRVTDIDTNALGFRGGAWTPAGLEADAPVPGRVLQLGDSQAFGNGVDHPLGTRLAAHLDAEVLNTATPTCPGGCRTSSASGSRRRQEGSAGRRRSGARSPAAACDRTHFPRRQ